MGTAGRELSIDMAVGGQISNFNENTIFTFNPK